MICGIRYFHEDLPRGVDLQKSVIQEIYELLILNLIYHLPNKSNNSDHQAMVNTMYTSIIRVFKVGGWLFLYEGVLGVG